MNWFGSLFQFTNRFAALADIGNRTLAAEMQQEVSEFQLAEVRNNDAVALAQSPALAEWSDFNGDAMLVDVALRCGMPLPTEIDTALHSAVVRVVREWQNGNSDIYQYSNDELKAIDQMRALKRARAALLHMDPRRRHFVCHVGSEAAQFRHALVHVDYFDLAVPCDDDAHRRLAEQSAVTMRAFEQCVAPHALTFVERYIRSLVIESIDLTSANVPLDHLAPLSHAMRATIVLSPNSRIGPGQAATLVHDDALSHATMPSELFDIPLPFVDHCADNNDTIDDNHDGVASAEDRLLYVHERTRVALLAHLDEALALLMDVKSVMKWNAIVASLGAADRQSAIYLLHQHRVNIENGQFESNHTIESSLVACDADGVERRVHLFRPKFCAVLPPRTVTVFFGGTSSHAAHCVHSSQWPRGELLASLAALHPGANGAGNYLYVDGISGTGVGLDHDWRFAPHGQTPVSVASGEGLIESAQHALCWLKGFSLYDKDTDALSAVYGSRAPIERVNVVGWSRGGVAAILLSHLIADDAWLGPD
jgi:hypothetical protein